MLKANVDNLQLASSDTGSSSQKSSDVSPEQEIFLYELETSDSGSIGLVLRYPFKCIKAVTNVFH